MLKGFKDFIMRGNVMELAVAVVIGSAFAAVVDAVVTNLVTPVLNSFSGATVDGMRWQIISGRADTAIDFAVIINSVIVFLITAAVVYLIFVMPMNRFNEMRRRGIEEPEEVAEELATLREIRDLLAARRADDAL